MSQQKDGPLKNIPKRAYVGNLNHTPDVEERVRALFFRSAIPLRKVDIIPLKQPNSKCYALVECDVDLAIKCLDGIKFDGGFLSVKYEKKRGNIKKQKNMGFGGGWAAPNTLRKAECRDSEQTRNSRPLDMAKVIENGIGSTVSHGTTNTVTSNVPSDDISAFRSRCNLSLDHLMQEYGNYDPDYEKMKSMQVDRSSLLTPNNETPTQNNGMLAPNGKAPIHIEVVSFGFKYSVPPQAREGWSHSNPLSPIDCRDLPRCPYYVAKFSGLSHKVKRAMIRLEDENVEENSDSESSGKACPKVNPIVAKSEEVSGTIISAIEEAITEGGHGYAFPLEVTIFLGSDYGRHRSVVLCEIVAQKIRNILRINEGGRIAQPVSVSVRHRDVDKNHRDEEAFGTDLKREHDAELRRIKKQEWLEKQW